MSVGTAPPQLKKFDKESSVTWEEEQYLTYDKNTGRYTKFKSIQYGIGRVDGTLGKDTVCL